MSEKSLVHLESQLEQLKKEKASMKEPISISTTLIIFVAGFIMFMVLPLGGGAQCGMAVAFFGLVALIFASILRFDYRKRHAALAKEINEVQKQIEKAKEILD